MHFYTGQQEVVIILLKLSKSYADPKIVCSLCKLTELAGVVEMETEPKRSPLQNLRTQTGFGHIYEFTSLSLVSRQ